MPRPIKIILLTIAIATAVYIFRAFVWPIIKLMKAAQQPLNGGFTKAAKNPFNEPTKKPTPKDFGDGEIIDVENLNRDDK